MHKLYTGYVFIPLPQVKIAVSMSSLLGKNLWTNISVFLNMNGWGVNM